MPGKFTRKALRLMHTEHRTAARTCPFLVFILDEFLYANFLNTLEVVYYTRAILGSIALIQVHQACTRKVAAIKAILDFALYHIFAGFNPAHEAGFGLGSIFNPATGAWVSFPAISPTETAIYSAGGD
jgi:hypothetical protein